MGRVMYGLAISASLMALLLLTLLYVLFHMGLRENMAPLDDGTTKGANSGDCTFKTRVEAMAIAWNNTINSPKFVNTDTNVQYKMWSSNVIRRGLDQVYTHPELFSHLIAEPVDEARLRQLMAPYHKKELQIASENQRSLVNVVHGVCSN